MQDDRHTQYTPDAFFDPQVQELNAAGHYKDRTADRERLAADVQEFLKNGGEIQQIEQDAQTTDSVKLHPANVWGRQRFGNPLQQLEEE